MKKVIIIILVCFSLIILLNFKKDIFKYQAKENKKIEAQIGLPYEARKNLNTYLDNLNKP